MLIPYRDLERKRCRARFSFIQPFCLIISLVVAGLSMRISSYEGLLLSLASVALLAILWAVKVPFVRLPDELCPAGAREEDKWVMNTCSLLGLTFNGLVYLQIVIAGVGVASFLWDWWCALVSP